MQAKFQFIAIALRLADTIHQIGDLLDSGVEALF